MSLTSVPPLPASARSCDGFVPDTEGDPSDCDLCAMPDYFHPEVR